MTNDQLIAAFERFMVVLERIAIAIEAPKVTGTAPETLQPPAPVSSVAGPSAPDTPGAAPSFTYDEICATINAYGDRHGHKAAKELLTSFGATYIKALKPEQYADVMKAFA